MAKDDIHKPIKTVLVTHLSTIGDVAMAMPIIYIVCHANPKVNFVMATSKEAKAVFANQPSNLIVLGLENKSYRGIIGSSKLASNLHHRYNFDAMVDLNNTMRTKLMALTLRAKDVAVAAIDNIYKEPRKILGGNIKLTVTPVHAHYKAAFQKVGLKTEGVFNNIFDNYDNSLSDNEELPRKEDGEKWVAIAPFATHDGKQYPLEQMQLVVSEIARWEKHTIFLMASDKNHDNIQSIAQRYDNVVATDNSKLSVTNFMILLSNCDVMVTMDTAFMHLASLVSIPAVSVWGATHPASGFLAWHQANKDTIHLDLDCQPCSLNGKKKCRYRDYHCLRDISPELIINKVKKVLER